MVSRFQALIAVIAKTSCASSRPSKVPLARSQPASGTCPSATSVIASHSSSAARSRSL